MDRHTKNDTSSLTEAALELKDTVERLRTMYEITVARATAEIIRLNAELSLARKDSEYYRWIKEQKGLSLTSGGGTWIKGDRQFSASHNLCANGISYEPRETLDETIDAAKQLK